MRRIVMQLCMVVAAGALVFAASTALAEKQGKEAACHVPAYPDAANAHLIIVNWNSIFPAHAIHCDASFVDECTCSCRGGLVACGDAAGCDRCDFSCYTEAGCVASWNECLYGPDGCNPD